VQISDGKGDAHLVKFTPGIYEGADNLKKLLSDPSRAKIFHFARFDVSAIKFYLGVDIENIYCTKIASKLVRTYTDKHGLKDLCKEFLNVEISKQQQCSNWGAEKLTKEQIDYAASDVLYLHGIREKLNFLLEKENRKAVAQKCFDFVPVRSELDLGGWHDLDIFHH